MKKLTARILSLLLVCTLFTACIGTAFAEVLIFTKDPGTVIYVRATARVNVRSGPGMSNRDMGTLETDEQVEYLYESQYDAGGTLWYKVKYYSFGDGWVSAVHSVLHADKAGSAGVSATTPVVIGTFVRGTNGDSNLRTGPALSYKDIGTVHQDEVATYLNKYSIDERGVVWYYVNFNGKIGWLSSRYTTLYSAGIPNWNWGSTASVYYVRATARVNVRSGPGMKFSDIATLDKGEKVEYLNEMQYDENNLSWYKVKYYSMGIGWVSAAYSEIVADAPSTAGVQNTTTNVNGTYVEATKGKSNIRSGPGLDYDDLSTIKKGQIATYLGKYSVDERGVMWYYVNFNGTIGWLSSRYTTLK